MSHDRKLYIVKIRPKFVGNHQCAVWVFSFSSRVQSTQSAIHTLVYQGKLHTRVLVPNFGPQKVAHAESYLK